jgi:hypothetical protein
MHFFKPAHPCASHLQALRVRAPRMGRHVRQHP